MTDPFVRVVVLNWGASWLTTRCIRSLQQTDYPADRLEVVVVDNGSGDGSLARLRRAAGDGPPDGPRVQVRANGANLGFAEGCNRALRDLDGVDLVALVNNDAMVDPGWLRPLVAEMAARPDAGAVCPAMWLEPHYAALTLEPLPGTEGLALRDVELGPCRLLGRCIGEGIDRVPTQDRPLEEHWWVRRRARLLVPTSSVVDRAVPLRLTFEAGAGGVTVGGPSGGLLTAEGPGRFDLTVELDRGALRCFNSLGTDLMPWREGYDRWFGVPVRELPTHDVTGWSGGAVLLRPAMLEQVGLFDPRHFAYYEDTDLAWRARRAGWVTRCVPASVVHHRHGGSAGPTARGFFFLNYRNWLVTVLRNGGPAEVLTGFRWAGHLSWPSIRRHVIGRIRRGHRPRTELAGAWGRVALGVAARAPKVLAGRVTGRRVGRRPPARPRPWLMPQTPSRPPAPTPDGPLVVAVDVTETLRSGWRAGIQRLTAELVRGLGDADIEVLPLTWDRALQSYRRLDDEEYDALLAPTAAQQPAIGPVPPPPAWRRAAGRMGRAAGLAGLAERARRWRSRAAVPPHHRSLVVESLAPATVFLDVDAGWNTADLPRAELLPRLSGQGVRIVGMVCDLMPLRHPEWFLPSTAETFVAHADALVRYSDELLAISRHTAEDLCARAAELGVAVRPPVVVPLGSTPPAPVPDGAPPPAADGSYLLMVGTVEPRKNHAMALEVLDRLRVRHPELHLVVVGRAGWRSEDVQARLASHPGVRWRRDVGDDELDALYRHAAAVLVPSITEGYGLPVVEALARGAAVVASDGGGLAEVGVGVVDHVAPDDVDGWVRAVDRLLDQPPARRPMPVPTWADTCAQVRRVVRAVAVDALATLGRGVSPG